MANATTVNNAARAAHKIVSSLSIEECTVYTLMESVERIAWLATVDTSSFTTKDQDVIKNNLNLVSSLVFVKANSKIER